MTIAANNKKTKGRKKPSPQQAQDPMDALRSIIQEEMARREAKAAAPKAKQQAPQPAPVQAAAQPKPQAAAQPAQAPASVKPAPVKAAPAPVQAKKEPSVSAPVKNALPAPAAAKPHDPSLMSFQVLQITSRAHKLMSAFLARNKTLIDKLPSLDPANLGKAFTDFTNKVLTNPDVFVETHLAFWQDYVQLLKNTIDRANGKSAGPVISNDPADRRFKDAAWQENWVFDFIRQSYLLMARWAQSLVENASGLDPKMAHKVEFYTRQMVDALSPSNFWITNPEVLRTTMETGGENLIKGLENLLDDMERGQGQLLISMSDNNAFRMGENIATSKGKVVYQNELMQLIQYAPLTEKARKTPLLIVPPWINKFYILDMKDDNSFIRYLVSQGHTVFCISWVNPDERHAQMNFDDYMMLGPVAAAREIARITGESKLNTVGYCIGGTLLASTLGWLEGQKEKPKDIPEISSATYLVTMIDFAEPGDLGVFIDEDQIRMVESMMEAQGYLTGTLMATTFSMLRANDLIWSFVVNNYLLGREPFPFDLLTWNSDSTNLPAAMQSYYLRNMYLENKLIQPNGLKMKDVPIDLTKIKVPTFCLSTHDDHITPWRSTYRATQTYTGPVTFCLSGSGHIAGVVNPPTKNKYGFWLNNGHCPENPDEWMKQAQKREGSWWPAWIEWLDQYAGELVDARDPAANSNVIEDAPGSYVKIKVV